MNDANPIGSGVPPQIPPTAPTRPKPPTLGDDPTERVPITNPSAAIEAILPQPRRLMYALRQPGAGGLIAGRLFGAVLGSLWSAGLAASTHGIKSKRFVQGAGEWFCDGDFTLGYFAASMAA